MDYIKNEKTKPSTGVLNLSAAIQEKDSKILWRRRFFLLICMYLGYAGFLLRLGAFFDFTDRDRHLFVVGDCLVFEGRDR